MVYKLENLEQLALTALPAAPEGDFKLTEAERDRMLYEVLQETERIKEELVQQVFQFNKQKEIEVFIKNYQLALTVLLDKIYVQEQQVKKPGKSIRDYYQSFYRYILQLLSFIEERFSRYFDTRENRRTW